MKVRATASESSELGGAGPASNSRVSVIEAELQSGKSPMELDELPLGGRGCQVWMEPGPHWSIARDVTALIVPRTPHHVALRTLLCPSSTLSLCPDFAFTLVLFSLPLLLPRRFAENCLEEGCFAKRMDEILAGICLASGLQHQPLNVCLKSSHFP